MRLWSVEFERSGIILSVCQIEIALIFKAVELLILLEIVGILQT
jgi:hypothetical protein